MSAVQPNPQVAEACTAAGAAFSALAGLACETRANLLQAIAAALETRRDEILQTCADETALTIDELKPEFARMTGTLGMFADLVREGSWVRAAIDTPTDAPIGPNHDIRSILVPLGPVAVFGSSNFPLAYGVCGGDTASALAAGCPVIIKEHPAHPRTGRLLAGVVQAAINEPRASASSPATHNSRALLQYLHNEDQKDLSVAQQLVQNEHIAAVGFTGSIPGGLAIEKLARERRVPIPVFAEMGSLNPVLVTSAALDQQGPAIGEALANSILARVGQQCTRPGLIFLEGDDAAVQKLLRPIQVHIGRTDARNMLTSGIYFRFADVITRATDCPGVREIAEGGALRLNGRATIPLLLEVNLGTLQTTPALLDEMFGPAAIVVRTACLEDVQRLHLPGNLTCTIWHGNLESSAQERSRIMNLAEIASKFTGRIIFNGVPTGVRVATSMVHGGPYPATNRPDTTAVGPRAIERWCRPLCFQNCPELLLPPELQTANPRGIWRTVNGQTARASLD